MAQASCHLSSSCSSSAPACLHASAPPTRLSLRQIYPGSFLKLHLDLKPPTLSYPNASISKSTYKSSLHSNHTQFRLDKYEIGPNYISFLREFVCIIRKRCRSFLLKDIHPALWIFVPAFALCIGLQAAEMNEALAQKLRVNRLDVRVSNANVDSSVILDYANVLSGSELVQLEQNLKQLESNTSWKIRVLTTSRNAPIVSQKNIRDLWNPTDQTLIIVGNLSSPNILDFKVGDAVRQRLPRQFFNELQSRYGNQFFVRQEGEAEALLQASHVLMQCLTNQAGCRNVPGLTNDLYLLTLATSIVGGCVFGFAARLPPSGRVEFSWQWVVIFSPLWLLLFGSFGILPILGRTSDWEPVVKNIVGFVMGGGALYLTPIFGASPIAKRDE